MTEVTETPEVNEAVEVTEELEGGFSRRTLGWIIGSVAVSLTVTLLLTIRAETLDRRPPTNNSFSYSALGHNAVVEFLGTMGLGVVPNRSMSGGDIGPQRPLVLAEPDPREPVWDPERLNELARRARDRKAPLVLILPKWRAGAPRKDKPEWLERVRLRSQEEALRVATALDHPGLAGISIQRVEQVRRCSSASESFAVEADPLQLLAASKNMKALVGCEGGVLIAQWEATDASPILLISDPDLLNNQGLGRADHAKVIHQLFTRELEATGAVFDETIHGLTRTPGLLAEATSFPLVLAVLQGLVLLGVVLWAGMGRFGKPLPVSLGLAASPSIRTRGRRSVRSSCWPWSSPAGGGARGVAGRAPAARDLCRAGAAGGRPRPAPDPAPAGRHRALPRPLAAPACAVTLPPEVAQRPPGGSGGRAQEDRRRPDRGLGPAG